MNLYFLPPKILKLIKKQDLNGVYEIRLRKDCPIKLITKDKQLCFLVDEFGEKVLCDSNDILHVINAVTDNSLYAFNDRIKEGYITTQNGVRIGVAGECVFSGEQIVTIKNFSSLNIRLPRFVKDCSKYVFEKICLRNEVLNTLIVSAPGYGKTTMLKDLARQIDERLNKNLLIIDERGEFCELFGVNIDKITYSNKFYAFTCALRAMSPDIVITDELVGEVDFQCVKRVADCGVKIVASCHADSLDKVVNKKGFCSGVFDRYVLLDNTGKAGVVKTIVDKEFNVLL